MMWPNASYYDKARWRVWLHCFLRGHRQGSASWRVGQTTHFCWDCDFAWRPIPTQSEADEHFERERRLRFGMEQAMGETGWMSKR